MGRGPNKRTPVGMCVTHKDVYDLRVGCGSCRAESGSVIDPIEAADKLAEAAGNMPAGSIEAADLHQALIAYRQARTAEREGREA